MPNQNFSINTRRPFGVVRGGRQTLRDLANWLEKIISGKVQSDAVVFSRQDAVALGDAAYGGQACGLLVGSTLTGTVGATIDGTAVTVTAAGGDTATQTLLAAAIKANSSVNAKVTCAQRVAQLTLASVLVGTTVRIFGVLFTAVSGTPVNPGEFDISGSDTADATSLALAINRHPSLAGRCRAVSSVGAVYVGLLEDRTALPGEIINLASAATITINTAVPVAGATLLVLAAVPGAIGNCCTVVASGTGMTYATANAGKLGAGQGGGTTFTYVVP